MEEKRFFARSYTLKDTDETKAYYGEWAEVYDQEVLTENGYRQPERCAAALSKVLTPGNQQILDIGCGTGLSGKALHDIGFTHIDGCDLSPEMLQKARQTGCYQRLFETNLNNPPIDCPDAFYQGVTAVGVFSFGHITPNAIDEILRVMAPGSPLVIGLNDKFYNQGDFPAKLEVLESEHKIAIAAREHGIHLANIEGSTGWVITSIKQ